MSVQSQAYAIIDNLLQQLQYLKTGKIIQFNTYGSAGRLAKEILDTHKLVTYRSSKPSGLSIIDIAHEGLQVIKAGGIKDYLEKKNKREQLSDELVTKELQKINLEIDDLVGKVADYTDNKWKTKWSFILSVITVLIAAIALIVSIVKE